MCWSRCVGLFLFPESYSQRAGCYLTQAYRTKIGVDGLQPSLGRESFTSHGVSEVFNATLSSISHYFKLTRNLKVMECCQLILLDLPTIIAVNDLHISMPCHDELWRCKSFPEWERARVLQRGNLGHIMRSRAIYS